MKAMKSLVLMIMCSMLLASCNRINPLNDCPPNTIIEWVDLLMIGDIKYEHHFPEPAHENMPITIEKGKELGKVTYRMADSACSNHKMQNGHAAFLTEGTSIYEIKGYPSALMVVADDVVYVASENKQAKTAGDLYPIDQLVKNIHIESTEDGTRMHTFSQASVDQFIAAFTKLKLQDVQSLNKAGKLDGTRIFLDIELNNGVSFRQLYWMDSNVFHDGAIGNDEIKAIINDELFQMKK
ncbi:hypothetical protein NSQ62_07390 [Solibacillus sp. FSL H8-0523]|uniref:hypothetical protein n=1 Tax=Solibacillus sp. FSL H8-0523 TaxID=2954511 RepID=UPI003100C06F